MDPVAREEALEELARLERRLARREKRAKRREEKKALVAKANQDWQINTEQQQLPSQEKDLFEGMECSNEYPASQDMFASSFILASQLPMVEDKLERNAQSQRRHYSSYSNKSRARGVSFARGPLYGLRERNINSLRPLESFEDFPVGWIFRMPQPNADKILRTTHFSLPREYTSMKLETQRVRDVLSQQMTMDLDLDYSYQPSQSLLAPRRSRKKRKMMEEASEAPTVLIDAGGSLEQAPEALNSPESNLDQVKENLDHTKGDIEQVQEALDSMDVGLWSQFSSQDSDVRVTNNKASPNEEEFLRALLGEPPAEGWVAAMEKYKRPFSVRLPPVNAKSFVRHIEV